MIAEEVSGYRLAPRARGGRSTQDRGQGARSVPYHSSESTKPPANCGALAGGLVMPGPAAEKVPYFWEGYSSNTAVQYDSCGRGGLEMMRSRPPVTDLQGLKIFTGIVLWPQKLPRYVRPHVDKKGGAVAI